jgi:hypothetical protein
MARHGGTSPDIPLSRDEAARSIASFLRSAGIDGSAAYTAAFVTMALAIALIRVAVTAFRAVRLTGNIPLARHHAAAGMRHGHTHLHGHAY